MSVAVYFLLKIICLLFLVSFSRNTVFAVRECYGHAQLFSSAISAIVRYIFLKLPAVAVGRSE